MNATPEIVIRIKPGQEASVTVEGPCDPHQCRKLTAPFEAMLGGQTSTKDIVTQGNGAATATVTQGASTGAPAI